MSNYVIIFGCVLVVAIGQLLFKLVGLRMGARGFDIFLEDYKSAALFLTALVFYGASTLGWVLALRQVPLSTAYLFMSMSFVLVPVGAWYFLNETLDVRTLAGSALIISGIALASSG